VDSDDEPDLLLDNGQITEVMKKRNEEAKNSPKLFKTPSFRPNP
jgi:hypothetical protein